MFTDVLFFLLICAVGVCTCSHKMLLFKCILLRFVCVLSCLIALSISFLPEVTQVLLCNIYCICNRTKCALNNQIRVGQMH